MSGKLSFSGLFYPAATVAKAMKPARKRTRQPAIADVALLRELLRKVEASAASPVTTIGSRLLALTAVRPAVLRGATWDELEGIDRDASDPTKVEAVWRIPARRMKLVADRTDDESYEHLVKSALRPLQTFSCVSADPKSRRR